VSLASAAGRGNTSSGADDGMTDDDEMARGAAACIIGARSAIRSRSSKLPDSGSIADSGGSAPDPPEVMMPRIRLSAVLGVSWWTNDGVLLPGVGKGRDGAACRIGDVAAVAAPDGRDLS